MSEGDGSSGNKRQKLTDDPSPAGEDELFEDLERSIIGIIFQIGLTQSSPKAIIGLMPDTQELTREHVKSHLQV